MGNLYSKWDVWFYKWNNIIVESSIIGLESPNNKQDIYFAYKTKSGRVFGCVIEDGIDYISDSNCTWMDILQTKSALENNGWKTTSRENIKQFLKI